MRLLISTLFLLLTCGIPSTWALPTAESSTLAWDPYSVQSYIYYTPRQPGIECRDLTTYTNGARVKLADPTATTAALAAFLPGQLKELCFTITAYDDQDRESAFARRKVGENDWGWTGMISPTEFEVQ